MGPSSYGDEIVSVDPSDGIATDGGNADETTPERAFVLESRMDDVGDRYRILVPILDSDTDEQEERDIERLLVTASSLARERNGVVHLVNVVLFPEQTPLRYAEEEPQVVKARTDVERLLDLLGDEFSGSIRGSVCLAHKETRALLHLLEDREYDAVFLGTRDTTSQRRRLLRGDTVDGLLANATCDVYVERFGVEPYVEGLGSMTGQAQRLLLAVADSPHSELSVDVARTVAKETNARIDIVHCVPLDAAESDIETATELVERVSSLLHDVPETGSIVVKTGNAPEELIHRSNNYDVTVLGAPREGLLKQFIRGSLPERVRLGTKNTVLMARRGAR